MYTRRHILRRFAMALAGASLLAVTLSAPAGAAADPAPTPGDATNNLTMRVVPDQGLRAYECAPAAYACFYTGTGGTGARLELFRFCGFYGLYGSPVMDNVHSIRNQIGAPVSLYNWTGHGYELKGWVYGYQSGNFHDNVGADVVNLFC
jgi:hypothetical protein